MMYYHVDFQRHIVRSIERLLNLGGINRERIVIYPFGLEGKVAKAILNTYFEIKEYMVVDNYLSLECDRIKSLDDLCREELSEITVIIASDNREIYDGLRDQLFRYISREKCYELLPRPATVSLDSFPTSDKDMSLYDYAFKAAIWDTAQYINDNMSSVQVFSNRYQMLEHCLLHEVEDEDGAFYEFGVYKGDSINFISSIMSFKTIYGFDSFEGLPVDWYGPDRKGTFNLDGVIPRVNANVKLVKGWFDDILPIFFMEHKERVSFVHIDSDVYVSAKTIFENISDRISDGTVIVFDEYFNRPGWREGEYKAWQEYVEKRKIKYKYIGFVSANYSSCQVAIKVEGIGNENDNKFHA